MTPQETTAHLQSQLDECRKVVAAKAELARFEQITKDAADWIEANYTESLPPIPGPEPTDSDWKVSLLTEALRALPNLIAAHCAAATAKERHARELAEGEVERLSQDRDLADEELAILYESVASIVNGFNVQLPWKICRDSIIAADELRIQRKKLTDPFNRPDDAPAPAGGKPVE